MMTFKACFLLAVAGVQVMAESEPTKCNKVLSCDDFPCPNGQECYMMKTNCCNPPCPETPSCRPSCQVIRCKSGYVCKEGKCIEEPIDKCAFTTCATGTTCIDGNCIYGTPTCKDIVCSPYQECHIKVNPCLVPPCPSFPECRTKCEYLSCQPGYICSEGLCKVDRCATVRCAAGYNCVDGECVPINKCALVLCLEGTTCIDGVCIENSCVDVKCDTGYICKGGECIENSCVDVKCDTGYICKGGECILDKCAIIRCGYNKTCVDGRCVSTCNGVVCKKDQECFLDQVQCFQEPCDPIPTCGVKCGKTHCYPEYICVDEQCYQDPCEGFCGDGFECLLEEVVCVRAPCLPVPYCKPVQ